MSKKKFFCCIGNPPYQDDESDQSYSKPLYNTFMDASYNIADKVEFITPARFLSDAGGTPKDWNEKMRNDTHLKVIDYQANASKVFPGTDIKGGVVVTYHDVTREYEPIGTFTQFPELNTIIKKVHTDDFVSFSDIVKNRGVYRFSSLAYSEHPEIAEKMSDLRIASSAFERLPHLFFTDCPDDGHEYAKMIGRLNSKRVYKWFRNDYIKETPDLDHYKVIVPKANGSGALGEVLSTPIIGTPIIGTPIIGYTETFIGVGDFDTENEAVACFKYIKTKFARTMLGVLKVTQSNPRNTWRYVPMQDFTANSDIDWSQSVADIDRQLYEKYGLDNDEIAFIEKNVKAMP